MNDKGVFQPVALYSLVCDLVFAVSMMPLVSIAIHRVSGRSGWLSRFVRVDPASQRPEDRLYPGGTGVV